MKTAKIPATAAKKPGRKPKDESPSRKRVNRSPGRSPSRRQASPEPKPKATPRSRSPARKSPARKSPGRKPSAKKSPTRKSPSRAAKEIKYEDFKNTPYVNLKDISSDIDFKKMDSKNGIDTNNVRIGLRERKPRFIENFYSESRKTTRNKEFENLYNIAQNTELPKNDISIEESKNDHFSDDDLPLRKLITPIRDVKNTQYEFGGPLGALSFIVSSLLIIAVDVACSGQVCGFTSLPDLRRYSKLSSWINLPALIIFSSYLLLQLLLSLVPYVGRKTVLPDGKHTFNANSVFALVVLCSIIAAVEAFYTPVTQLIYDNYIQLLISAFGFGIILAISLYVKSRKIPINLRNSYGNTGNLIYDFYMGREVNPVFFGIFHVKVLLFRIALIGVILLNTVWIYRGTTITNFPVLTNHSNWNIETFSQAAQSVSVNPTLLLFSAMQIFYLFDSLFFETAQVSTFEFLYEGVGYLMSVGYFSYPFIPTIISKRILDQDIRLPYYVLVPTLILFLAGFYIYRKSNSQKSIFRANPLDPRVSHLETLPTMQGKRLLISGWWGFVRHPNYLGDLMMHTAWAVGTYNALPIYATIFTYWLLVNRSKRDGNRCSERYGMAWKRYCQKVPYCIVPRVY